jgi:hypothetical protein
MDKIKAQADKLWQLISNSSTANAYQQALALTWSIIKETGLLLWLVICLVLVVGDWFWKYSFTAGQNTRAWLTDLQTKSTSDTPVEGSGDFWSGTGKSLLAAGQNSLNAALNTARDQLGIEAPPASVPKAIAAPAKSSPPTPAVELSPLVVDESVMNEPKVPPIEAITSSDNSVIIAEESEEASR